MAEELNGRLDVLRAIAPRLNQATDEATRIVLAVEDLLVKQLGIGISAESECLNYHHVVVERDGEREIVAFQYLAFGRVLGSYRIHVLNREQYLEDNSWEVRSEERTPWGSCSREEKLDAFQKLPQLLDEIINKAERLAKAADETAVKVKEFGLDISPEPERSQRSTPVALRSMEQRTTVEAVEAASDRPINAQEQQAGQRKDQADRKSRESRSNILRRKQS